MSYLLFMDESGHDHRVMPYEVRGGVALPAGQLWPFVQAMKSLEEASFGDQLGNYGREIKGSHLLDKDRFRWAAQSHWMDDLARRKHAVGFLNKGVLKSAPTFQEFTAYGQACLMMARGIFSLLQSHEARLFAVAIPRNAIRPKTYEAAEFLRKDHVFLLERYFYFLERNGEPGLIVMDETEKQQDKDFVRRMEAYFTRTQTGRYRASRIVPNPFFVASDMNYGIQAADVCIYCVNWGFRLPTRGMNEAVRAEIAEEFAPWLFRLQYSGEGYREGFAFQSYGIAFVADPYTPRLE